VGCPGPPRGKPPFFPLGVPWAPVFDLSVEANPRAALAALRGIVVRDRLPGVGRTVRAADSSSG
jgi:hypothetical protein